MRKVSLQSGFSLLELMLALGIGALVMAVAFAAYDGRRNDAEVSLLDADVSSLVYKANMAYMGSGQYSLGNVTTLINATRLNDASGGLPSGSFIPDATMTSGFRNVWGGQASISAVSSNASTTRDLLQISLANIPPKVCIDIVARIAPRMYDTRVDGTLVGLSPAKTAQSQGRYGIRVAQVAPLCASATNTIVFRYLKPLNYSLFRSLPVSKTFTPGKTPQSDEATAIQANYTRIENAMTARETAQLAIP